MHVVAVDSIWDRELAPLLDPSVTFEAVRSDDVARRDAALADAVVVVSSHFTAAMGKACRQLRLLVCPAAGTEEIDRSALPAGVEIINGTGHEPPMAEYAMGCLIALRHHLMESDAALRRGDWRFGFHSGGRALEELFDTQMGLIGFGRIGQAIASRAAAFGMRCAAVTAHPGNAHAGSNMLAFIGSLSNSSDVDRLVSWSAQLVICCELSDLTRGLMDKRRFGLMKRGAALVNVARGPIAVEKDLYEALAAKQIAGAALDVWYRYPPSPGEIRQPSSFPFHALDNVIMTPHSSGWTEAAMRRRVTAMAQTINDFAHRSEQVV